MASTGSKRELKSAFPECFTVCANCKSTVRKYQVEFSAPNGKTMYVYVCRATFRQLTEEDDA